MAKQTIDVGLVADDGKGDTARVGGNKINDNFTELYNKDTAQDVDIDQNTAHSGLTNNPHGTDIENLGSGTLAELNAAVTDATLDDAGDPRDPNAHNHTASDVTDFDTEVGNHIDVAANTTHRGLTTLNAHGNTADASITIGTGAVGVDYTLTFDGDTSDGVLTWDESAIAFTVSDNFYVTDRLSVGGDAEHDFLGGQRSIITAKDTVAAGSGVTSGMDFHIKIGGGTSGAIPIGIAAVGEYEGSSSLSLDTVTGIRGEGKYSATVLPSTASTNVQGIVGVAVQNSTIAGGTFAGVKGLFSIGSSKGLVSEVVGLLSSRTNIPSGGVTDLCGVKVADGSTALGAAGGNYFGIYVEDQSMLSLSGYGAGIWIEQQANITGPVYGLVLDGDSAGADILLGADLDSAIYYDSADLILDPDLIGTGKVLIGATGDDDMVLNAIDIGGDITHTGTNAGFFSATPVTQPAHIVDADGTLADITTKFNTLLAQVAALGLQAAT